MLPTRQPRHLILSLKSLSWQISRSLQVVKDLGRLWALNMGGAVIFTLLLLVPKILSPPHSSIQVCVSSSPLERAWLPLGLLTLISTLPNLWLVCASLPASGIKFFIYWVPISTPCRTLGCWGRDWRGPYSRTLTNTLPTVLPDNSAKKQRNHVQCSFPQPPLPQVSSALSVSSIIVYLSLPFRCPILIQTSVITGVDHWTLDELTGSDMSSSSFWRALVLF